MSEIFTSRLGGSSLTTSQPKPLLTSGQVRRDRVANAGAIDALDVVAVVVGLVVALGEVLDGACRGLGNAEDVGPLLDGFLVILRVDGAVGAAVPDLHTGPLARVARVHVADDIAPLLGRGARLPARAAVIPLIHATRGRDEAPGGHAAVEGDGGDEFRVGGGHNVGHHGCALQVIY
jgi:hypothetical protein